MDSEHPGPTRPCCRVRRRIGSLALGLALVLLSAIGPCFAAPGPAVAPGAQPMPRVIGELLETTIDDPQRGLAEVNRRLQAAGADADTVFWLGLAAAMNQLLLEADADAGASLREARRRFEARPVPDEQMRAWLEHLELRLRSITDGGTGVLRALVETRARLRIPDGTVLACEWDYAESWLLLEMESYDEAWRASEALERCSRLSGWPHYRALALSGQARLIGAASLLDLPTGGAGRTGGGLVAPERVAGLFEEAYASVGPGEGRFLRSLIAYDAGIALTRLGRPIEATRQLQRALAASQSLGDSAGIAAALMAQATLEAGRKRHADVLRMLDEAEPVLRGIGTGNTARLMALYTQRLRSLVALDRRSQLPAALAGALALAESGVQPTARERLARAVAAGQAALGQHALAYQSMEQAHRLAEESLGQASRAQVLRLQALYDQSQREAELAELRHAKEAARLSLLAQQAMSSMLWVALGAASLLMAGAAFVGWRQWTRRREMAELALRDTLTGLPNRRAIEAYARAQLSQSRRLKLPFSLAMIDLDHFKAVNDRHGHATGDAVLRALAQAAPLVLRAPDRLGRWGGEEFLLVLPGTARHELPGLYRRLRDAFAAAPVPGLPQPHGCSFSMGAAEATGHADHIEALIDTADRRLYEAKAAGRDRLD